MSVVTAFPRLSAAEKELADGRIDAATQLVLQHLRENRNEPRGLALLGSLAVKTGALVQGEQFLRQAMSLGATSLEVQRELASAINQQERLGEALQAFTYLEQRSDDPQLRATKALILDKLGRNEQAVEAHRALTECYPTDPRYWIGLGHSLRSAGRLDEAVSAYRRATGLEPEHGEAWWALANIKSKVLTDEDTAVMTEALRIAIDPANIIPLHFALGRAWHDRSEHETAFKHFHEGNRLRAESINYEAGELTEEVDAFIRLFGSDFFAPGERLNDEGPVPVFLVSMPRSGSTLLEQMLDRHPDIEAVGELPYIRALIRSALELHTRRGPAKVPDVIRNLSDHEKRAFGEDYLQRAAVHRREGARYFIDKMPMNWSDVLFIRQILPQARFIDIRRSGMDCCFSNYVHYFSRAHAASFDLTDIGRCYVDYVRLMDHIQTVAPGFIHHVRYEQLVDDPERELRTVLDYLQLSWNADLLRFHESGRVVRTPSAEQVRRPLNREGMGAWRPYERWLDPLKKALGPLADS